MPIKLAKGFVRRKSSGNILEEVENRPQSSFRVMERPPVDGRSVSEGNLLSPKVGKVLLARRSSQPLEDPDNLYGSQNPQFQDRYGRVLDPVVNLEELADQKQLQWRYRQLGHHFRNTQLLITAVQLLVRGSCLERSTNSRKHPVVVLQRLP